MENSKFIGAILLEKGLINADQFEAALKRQKQEGRFLGEVLVDMDYINEEDLLGVLSQQLDIPYVDLRSYEIDEKVAKLISEELARRYTVIPLFMISGVMTVAMADPLDVHAIDEIHHATNMQIETVFSTRKYIHAAIQEVYRKGEEVVIRDQLTPDKSGEQAEEISVMKLVNSIIRTGVETGASDIHIEPSDKTLGIRYRIDGVLHQSDSQPPELAQAIISRIKIMADLDIAEKRLPQDGSISLDQGKKKIELRVSTYPIIYGENVVMRILDRSTALLKLNQLGFLERTIESYSQIIEKPNGIILVTGPTGCGKTTTLYATLSTINSGDKNIVTIEDPVEYKLEGIRQTQINPKAGLTFANGLRSMLRQDPDIIMVGEIRDMETAEIAVRAALTGHLVFSTLHTNDAPGAITRLIDIGIEPYLISSSVIGVVAQRLIRLLCPKCKKEEKIPQDMLDKMGLPIRENECTFYKQVGCQDCMKTGFKGRTSIFELLVIDEEIARLIVARADSVRIKDEVLRKGLVTTMREDGISKVKQGITTISEVIRVT